MIETDDIPPCLIRIDREGRWFHKGLEMLRRDFVRFFYEHMEMDSRGRYVIRLSNQTCYLDVEDTAFVVRRVVLDSAEEGEERLLMRLSDDTEEALNPETLHVGEENVLYCRVKDGRFPARFLRAAYYQLTERLEEEGGEYVISLGGKKHVFPQPPSPRSLP
jgi:hypothetical protein